MKVVLITGISSGFGYSIARHLSETGFKVYGTVRKKVDPIPGVIHLNMDITQPVSVAQVVQTVIEREGRIDILINNIGIGIGGPIEYTNLHDVRRLMDVNFLGMHSVIQSVLPIMRMQKEGQIICISSIGGLMGLPYQGIYSASKYAIEGYCESLRPETRLYNIKVTVINPGDFSTNFTSNRKKIDNHNVYLDYPAYKKVMQVIENDESHGLSPDILANKIGKILKKKNTANRYIIASPLQKLSVFVKRILPANLFNKILRKYYSA
jgi:short-subunit dehydrogenase